MQIDSFSITHALFCSSVAGVMDLVSEGSENRQVAETNMNHESSRSHVVLACSIAWKTTDENGIVTTKCSRLNLVDLAGRDVHFKAMCSQHTSLRINGMWAKSLLIQLLSCIGLKQVSVIRKRKTKGNWSQRRSLERSLRD